VQIFAVIFLVVQYRAKANECTLREL